MITKTLVISALALTLSVSGPQAFAKKSKKISSSSSSDSSSSSSSSKPADKADDKKTEAAPANNTTNNAQPAAAAPEQKSGGMGTAIAAGVGGAVIGGLAGAAIASSLSGDEKKDANGNTVSAPIPSPLLKMTPEDAVKSATEMQAKAKEAGFAFTKSDDMLKKTEELIAKDDAGKKQAHEIAVIVHTWAEAGVKQAENLKKVSEKLGI